MLYQIAMETTTDKKSSFEYCAVEKNHGFQDIFAFSRHELSVLQNVLTQIKFYTRDRMVHVDQH